MPSLINFQKKLISALGDSWREIEKSWFEKLGAGWVRLGAGSYNFVYLNRKRNLILKIAQNKSESTDTPERSVRLWNIINAHISPPAKITHLNKGFEAWTCPFIYGEQASEKEITHALIRIFNRVGRIVIDALSSGNFIKTPSGEVVCVDIGMALLLEYRNENKLLPQKNRRRQKSIVSLNAWTNFLRSDIFHYFNSPGFFLSNTTIKALLYIKSYFPNITNADFLLDPYHRIFLSNRYDTIFQYRESSDGELNKYLNGPDIPLYEDEEMQFAKLLYSSVNEVRLQLHEYMPKVLTAYGITNADILSALSQSQEQATQLGLGKFSAEFKNYLLLHALQVSDKPLALALLRAGANPNHFENNPSLPSAFEFIIKNDWVDEITSLLMSKRLLASTLQKAIVAIIVGQEPKRLPYINTILFYYPQIDLNIKSKISHYNWDINACRVYSILQLAVFHTMPLELIQLLSQNKALIIEECAGEKSALFLAVDSQQWSLFEYFLGEVIYAKLTLPLEQSDEIVSVLLSYQKVELVESFLRGMVNKNQFYMLLETAIKRRDEQQALLLIKRGVEEYQLQFKNALYYNLATVAGYILHTLIQQKKYVTALNLLQQHKRLIRVHKNQLLVYCLHSKNTLCAIALMQSGADPNYPTEPSTAFLLAVQMNLLEVVNTMLEGNVTLPLTRTTVQNAIFHLVTQPGNSYSIVADYILSHFKASDLNLWELIKANKFILNQAIIHNKPSKTIVFLCQQGLSVTQKDLDNKSPLDWAIELHRYDAIRALLGAAQHPLTESEVSALAEQLIHSEDITLVLDLLHKNQKDNPKLQKKEGIIPRSTPNESLTWLEFKCIYDHYKTNTTLIRLIQRQVLLLNYCDEGLKKVILKQAMACCSYLMDTHNSRPGNYKVRDSMLFLKRILCDQIGSQKALQEEANNYIGYKQIYKHRFGSATGKHSRFSYAYDAGLVLFKPTNMHQLDNDMQPSLDVELKQDSQSRSLEK